MDSKFNLLVFTALAVAAICLSVVSADATVPAAPVFDKAHRASAPVHDQPDVDHAAHHLYPNAAIARAHPPVAPPSRYSFAAAAARFTRAAAPSRIRFQLRSNIAVSQEIGPLDLPTVLSVLQLTHFLQRTDEKIEAALGNVTAALQSGDAGTLAAVQGASGRLGQLYSEPTYKPANLPESVSMRT